MTNDIEKQEWRTVPGYPNYQISIDIPEGRCRSLSYRRTGKIKQLLNKPQQNRIYWDLRNEGERNTQQAARWIALTFPELIKNEYFEGAEIDHINTDAMDNRPSNLRWVTRKENLNNPLTRKHNSESKKGDKSTLWGKHLPESTRKKISEKRTNNPKVSKKVGQYTKDGELIKIYPSTKQATRVTNINNGNIVQCCIGKYKTAGGYIWRYV